MEIQDLSIAHELDNAAQAALEGGARQVSRSYHGVSNSFSNWRYRGETYYGVRRGKHSNKWYSYRKYTRTQTRKYYYASIWTR